MTEASGRLEAALAELGFVGPEIAGDRDTFPLVLGVSYHRAEVTVHCELILWYAGEEYVHTSLLWAGDGPDEARRVKIGNNTAHTGYQMRRALDRHAAAVSEALRPLLHSPAPTVPPSTGTDG